MNRTGTLHKRGDRHMLAFERRLAHKPEKVWRALTESKELTAWFPADMRGERKVGAALQFVFAGDDSTPTTGKVTAFEPPSLFEYTWEDELLRWELRPDGDGCLLVFTATFDDRAKAARDGTGWHMCLDNLEEALAGRKPLEDKARFGVLNAEYAARFGLGEFPVFLKNAVNRAAEGAPYTPGIERYVFDGAGGIQMELWHARSETHLPETLRDYEEYLVVVEGEYLLRINGMEFPLGPGREFVIPPHARVSARLAAGTRTLHGFGGRPAAFGARAAR
jgi:uncharacterized protein YndB with AHSA1/START domain/mannose-6-phosphate isomerase-like protein (cupin superfamily)